MAAWGALLSLPRLELCPELRVPSSDGSGQICGSSALRGAGRSTDALGVRFSAPVPPPQHPTSRFRSSHPRGGCCFLESHAAAVWGLREAKKVRR